MSDAVADYVACVRAQGAKLGEERSKKLSMEAGYAGVNASVASEARENLEKSYATSDSNTLEVIRGCNAMRERQDDACAGAATIGTACGFEPDSRFLAACHADQEFQRCAVAASGDCTAHSLCGFAQAGRSMCGGQGMPSGAAGCVDTIKCQAGCKGDVPCICDCNTKVMPSAAHAVALQNQCFIVHCTGCAGTACDTCAQQHCADKYRRWCEGR